MRITATTMRSFVSRGGRGGNRAGLVWDEKERLSPDQMQGIAARLAHPETAFIQSWVKDRVKLSFFTPTQPIELCGHATVATLSLLASEGRLHEGLLQLETPSGLLGAEVKADGRVFYEQPPPTFIIDDRHHKRHGELKDDVHAALHLDEGEQCDIGIGPDLVATVSGEVKDIIVAVLRERLEHIERDDAAITTLTKKYDAAGVHPYAFEKPESIPITIYNVGTPVRCRNFSPRVGIPEEAATGTSCGALAAYLHYHGFIATKRLRDILLLQGESLGSPSEIHVAIDEAKRALGERTFPRMHASRVWVGGRAAWEREETLSV